MRMDTAVIHRPRVSVPAPVAPGTMPGPVRARLQEFHSNAHLPAAPFNIDEGSIESIDSVLNNMLCSAVRLALCRSCELARAFGSERRLGTELRSTTVGGTASNSGNTWGKLRVVSAARCTLRL